VSPNNPVSQPVSKRVKLLTTIFGIVVIGLLALYLYRNREVFSSFQRIAIWQIIVILLTETIGITLGSLMNYSLTRRLGCRVTFLDSLMLQYINNFLNKVLPTIGGGAAFRSVYLKKKYDFPYSQFVSTLSGFYVISFVAISLIGLLCMLYFYLQYRAVNWVIIIAFLALLLPSLVIILFSPSIPDKKQRLFRILKSVVEGWNQIKADTRFILFYTFIVIAQLLLSAWQMQVAFQALGVEAGFVQTTFICSLGIPLAFLNFTPDGIGIREGVYMFSSSLVNIPEAMMVLTSLLLRGLAIFSTVSIGVIAYLVYLKKLKDLQGAPEHPA